MSHRSPPPGPTGLVCFDERLRRMRHLLAAAALAAAVVLAGQPEAQKARGLPASPKLFSHYDRPLRSASLDMATGAITRGPSVKNRGTGTIADFSNLDLSGFTGVDTGGGFCEWFDAASK